MEIDYQCNKFEANEQFSFKSFVNQSVRDHYSTEQLSPGIVIYRSSFYHEVPNSKSFPDDMTGVMFIDCNLDNVVLPPGNYTVNCSQKVFKDIDGIDQFLSPDLKRVLGPVYINKNIPLPWYRRFLKWMGF